MAATTALICGHVPIAALVALIDDYLCPADATKHQIGLCGHGERCSMFSGWNDVWVGVCGGGHISIIEQEVAQMHPNIMRCILLTACTRGQVPIMELMIAHDPDVDYHACMENACRGGNINAVSFLVKHGACAFQTGLIYSCAHNHPDIAEMMIRLGADPTRCVCRGAKHAQKD